MSDYELIDPVTITTRCIECENIFTILVPREDVDSYSKGDNKTYHLFKNLSPSEVDFHFIHNICQDCFDEYYQDEE